MFHAGQAGARVSGDGTGAMAVLALMAFGLLLFWVAGYSAPAPPPGAEREANPPPPPPFF